MKIAAVNLSRQFERRNVRTETIHDTVRRDKLEIKQPSNLPVVFQAAAKQEEKMKEERTAAGSQDKRSLVNPAQPGQAGMKADQKRAQ
jgi:hypothetical protein